MKIQFERSGGFAGMLLNTTIDSSDLPPEEARALQAELEAADFFNLPAKIDDRSRGADRFQYRITVEEKDRRHTVEFGEAAAPPNLQPLVERLSTLARTRGR